MPSGDPDACDHARRERRAPGAGAIADRAANSRTAARPSSAEAAGNVRRRVADAPSQTLRRSPLHDRHVAASARLVPFAGWEMPVPYAGIREEHVAVRTAAGVFDVSHMGQIETTGPQAAALLQRLVS